MFVFQEENISIRITKEFIFTSFEGVYNLFLSAIEN